MFSVYDMLIHSTWRTSRHQEPSVLNQLWLEKKQEISLVYANPETNYVASWMHLTAGYDAGYYGYLWSEVFAADMFSRFLKEGVLSPTVGNDYRRLILKPGASLEGMQMLQLFLGRKPTEISFLQSYGISP